MHDDRQQRESARCREGEAPSRADHDGHDTAEHTPQQNPQRLVRVADHRNRRVALKTRAHQLAYGMRVQRHTVYLRCGAACTAVRRIEKIFYAFGRHADQHHLVFKQRRIEVVGEQVRERNRGEAIGRIAIVQHELVARGIGLDVTAVVGFERPESRGPEANVGGVVRIALDGYPLCLEVEECGPQGHRVTDRLSVVQEQKGPTNNAATIDQHVGEADLLRVLQRRRRGYAGAVLVRKLHGADDLRMSRQHIFKLLVTRRHRHVSIDVDADCSRPVLGELRKRLRQHGIGQRPLPEFLDVLFRDRDDEDARGRAGRCRAHAYVPVVCREFQVLEILRDPQGCYGKENEDTDDQTSRQPRAQERLHGARDYRAVLRGGLTAVPAALQRQAPGGSQSPRPGSVRFVTKVPLFAFECGNSHRRGLCDMEYCATVELRSKKQRNRFTQVPGTRMRDGGVR